MMRIMNNKILTLMNKLFGLLSKIKTHQVRMMGLHIMSVIMNHFMILVRALIMQTTILKNSMLNQCHQQASLETKSNSSRSSIALRTSVKLRCFPHSKAQLRKTLVIEYPYKTILWNLSTS